MMNRGYAVLILVCFLISAARGSADDASVTALQQPASITAGPTTSLRVRFGTSTATAGTPVNVTVTSLDSLGNTSSDYTGTLHITSSEASAVVPADLVISNGTAVFPVTLKKAVGSSITVTDVATPTITGSGIIVVQAAPAAQLSFLQNPSDSVAGLVLSPSVTVKVLDPFGNNTSSSAVVALALGANPGAGTLAGTASLNALNGTATYSTLNLNKAGSGYTLVATSPGLASATSSSFSITPAASAQLAFVQGPTNANVGTWLAPPVTVQVLDAFGNARSSTANVTIGIGTNPGPGLIAGLRSAPAVAGIATFSKLAVDTSGNGYTLTASSPGLTGATSGTFNIAATTANHFKVSVNAALNVGTSYSGSVQVLDPSDNRVTGYSGVVDLICSDPAAVMPSQVTLVNGLGLFNITFKTSGGQTVTAYDDRGTIVGTDRPTLSPLGPASLSFSQQPLSATAGALLNPPVTVSILDTYGNVTGVGLTVSLEIASNPGGGTLLGIKSLAAISGVATFPDLSIRTSGTGYTLTATMGTLPPVVSSPFNITPGAGSQIVFGQQPTDCVAGQTFSPVITARLLDVYGNLTTSTGTVSLSSTGQGQLNSNPSQSLATGTASFPTAYLTQAGSYQLRLSATGVADQPLSNTFQILPGPVSSLWVHGPAFPSTASAGLPIAITVAALDTWGNFVPAYTGSVHFTSTDGAAVLPPDSPVLNGQTIFPVTFKTTGSQNLFATDTANSSLTNQTGPLTVNSAATSKIVITQQPGNTVAGTNVSPLVRVQTKDAFGNLTTTSVLVTLKLKANPGGAALTGATVLGGTGTVLFDSLSLDKTGTGYTLEASALGLTGDTSAPFNITPAAATHLGFLQPPVTTVAGSIISPPIKVQVLDAFENQTADSKDISLLFGNNPGGSGFSGTSLITATSGLATFPNISIAKAAPGYTFTASVLNFGSVTSPPFDIVPGPAVKFVVINQPGNTVAGVPIATALSVQLQDAKGNLTTSTANVTVDFATNAGGGTLSGTTTVAAVGGIATFPGLSIDKAGTSYKLRITSQGLPDATSGTFNITPAAPAKLAFAQQPSNAVAGFAIAPAITVQVQDAFGNLTASTASVSLAIGTNPGAGTLAGAGAVPAVNGVATFPATSINKVGTDYTLSANSSSLTSAVSNAITITPGAATHFAVSAPANTVAGTAITLTVNALDANNNIATGYAGSARFTSGDLAAVLPATTKLSAGTATVTATLKSSGNQTITAIDTLSSSITGTSGGVAVTAAAPAKLVFIKQPTSSSAGVPVAPAVTVQVQDAFGNATTSAATVTLAVTGSVFDPSSTRAVAAVSGLATFPNLVLTQAASYTLTATSPGLTNGTSIPSFVYAAAPHHIVLTTPAAAVAGTSFQYSANVVDAYGNVVSGYGGTIHFTSSDAAAVMPPDYTYNNAISAYGSVGSVMKTGGPQTITATEVTSGLISGTSGAIVVDPREDLAITEVAAPSPVIAGNELTYTFNLVNKGPSAAVNTQVTDSMSSYAGFVSLALPAGWSATVPAVGGNGYIRISKPNVAPGETAVFTLVVKVFPWVVSQSIMSDVLTFKSDVLDVNDTGNPGINYVYTRRSSDMAITMTASPAPVNVTQNITYGIDVVNNGPSDTSSVTVSDPLPANTTLVSATAPSGWSVSKPAVGGNGTVKFTRSDTAAGTSAHFTIVAKVALLTPDQSQLTNTATVAPTISVSEYDPVDDNNSSSVSTLVKSESELAVSGTSPTKVVAGTDVTYAFTTVNNGPMDANAALVSEVLPAGTTFVSATAPAGWSVAAPAAGANGTVNFNKASFANGTAAAFTVVAHIGSNLVAGSQLHGVVSASSLIQDLVPLNNTTSLDSTVTRSNDLALTMTDSPDPVNITQDVTYAIGVINLGPSDAAAVVVSDTLPANTTFVSATAPSGWTVTSPAAGAAGTVQFSRTSLAASGTGAFTIVAKVDRLAPDQAVLTNTATVSTTDPDPASANNSATTTTVVKSAADLAITGAAPATNIAGTDITYTLGMVNNGPMDATNAVVTVVLPTGLTYVSAIAPEGWSLLSPGAGANGSVLFTRPLVANGASADFTVVAHVMSSCRDGTVVQAGIAASSSVQDIVSDNSSASLATTLHTSSDLELAVTATPDPVVPGGNVTYAITVTNHGPSDAGMLRVSDVLPAHMTYVSSVPEQGWLVQAPSPGAPGEVDFSRTATLITGATAHFTIVTKVAASTPNGTRIANAASVASGEADPAGSNNGASTTVAVGTVHPSPNQLQVTGTLNRQNGLFELSVTVTNTTPDPINGFRLHVDYSAYVAAFPSLRLYNATGLSPGPYVDYPFPLPVDGAVTLKLQFYTSTRTFPNPFSPVLTMEKLAVSQLAAAFQKGVTPTLRKLADRTVLLEFPSTPGHWYRVRYSPDMSKWLDSTVPIQATGTKTQWIDNGPPFTNISPADPSVRSRFYQIFEVAAP